MGHFPTLRLEYEMNVSDLSIDERMALLALLAHVAAADGDVNADEIGELKELADEMGVEGLREQLKGAFDRFPTRESLLDYMRVVDRDEAQELIRTIAMDLAQSDGERSKVERDLISDVIAVWARDPD